MTTLMEKAVFSIYGVSIEHPMDWKIFFDPKRGCSRSTGFFRIEDFVPQKGAQLSLSLNWEKATSDNESFAHQYAEHIAQEYQKQMKKTPYQIERMEVIDFQGGKAAYIVSEYRGSPGLGAVLLTVGLFNAITPRTSWYLSRGWYYKNAEPSEAALFVCRAGGVFAAVLGVVLFFV